jgi:hypothetical protein
MNKTLDEILREYIELSDYVNLSDNLDDSVAVQDAKNRMETDIAKAKQAILQWIADEVVGTDIEHTKWFVDVTGEYDYFHPVKRPLVERHKNEHRDEQRAILKQHGWKGGE